MNAYAEMHMTFMLKECKYKFNKKRNNHNYEIDMHSDFHDENNKNVEELNQIKRCKFKVNLNRKEIEDDQRTRYG